MEILGLIGSRAGRVAAAELLREKGAAINATAAGWAAHAGRTEIVELLERAARKT